VAVARGARSPGRLPGEGEGLAGRFIVQIGMGARVDRGSTETRSSKRKSARELRGLLEKRNRAGAGAFFAERYVEGREFNISLLGGRLAPPTSSRPRRNDLRRFSGRHAEDTRLQGEVGRRLAGVRLDGEKLGVSRRRRAAPRETERALAQVLGHLRVERVRQGRFQGRRGREALRARDKRETPAFAPDSGFVAAAAKSGLGSGT